MRKRKRKNRLRLFLVMALCGALLTGGPIDPLQVYGNMDPDVIAAAREAAQQKADDKSADGEPEEAEEEEEEEQPAERQEKSSEQDQYKQRLSEISDKMNDLKAEKDQIQRSLNATQSEKEKELANKQYLDQQIGITRSEISLLEERISLLEAEISIKELEIADKQADIEINYEKFKIRLRALQLNDEATVLGLLLGADSFSDFLSRTETVVRIAEHDRALMEVLSAQKKDLEEDKQFLEDTRAEVEADKAETEEKKQVLNVQLNAAQAAVYSLEQLEQEFRADLEANIKKSEQMQQEMNEIYRQMELSNNPYVGGEMTWPVPGFYTISSPYGYRWSGTDYHTGIDIAGGGRNIYAASIVAANAGTVKLVNWNYTPGYSYGRYLVIDHGGQTTTLYGHCSNIVVSVGDYVEKGQKVAEVGSTGWSTGPHLHFEVRIGAAGQHTDPIKYVTASK